VFTTYAELYATADGFDLPALIPQVYVHYDPYTRRERGGRGPLVNSAWPAAMRVFARRERPHPRAQLSLSGTRHGWRYSLWVSNVPAQLRGWRAQLGYIEAAHRVHARVEDCIRTGKDCGIGRFPRMISR
jgi:hypothetical protein